MSINTQKYHRMNLCIEIPALGGDFPKTGTSRFHDILMYVHALTERSMEDAKLEIANCIVTYSTEFNVNSELKPEVWGDNREEEPLSIRTEPDK